ncbi:MAG: alpha/beta fold hydrolase, partial [Candidatus Omnitrophota bacterium]
MESYKSYGKGRPLIFIHGWSSSPKVWKYQVDHFAKWYNVFTVEPLMENLEKLMADSILDKKPILVGWSYGAMLAKEIIMKYPNKVYAAAFIASNAKFVSSDDYKPGLPRVIVEKLSRDMGRDFENSLMRAYRLFFSEVEKQSGL